MSDQFKIFAKYYDILYGPDAYQEAPGEIEFFSDLAKNAKGKVLEVACGTGRILLPLLQEGYQVEGMDISQEMLDICQEKADILGLNPPLKQGDMRYFELPEKYPLIIAPLNSIQHLTSSGDQKLFLNQVNKHLINKGIFVFTNQFFTDEIKELKNFTYVETYAYSDWDIELELFLKFDQKTNILAERFFIYDGNVKKDQRVDLMEIYSFDFKELHKLLEECGFKVVNVFQDFKNTPFEEGADNGIWILQKL